MSYTLNLHEVNYALSEALDYVGIDDIMHGKRVAYMSAEIAKKLGWSKSRINDIIMMGMLHDCGVSSTDIHTTLVNEFDWENSQNHCKRGALLLEKVSIYKDFAPVIFYHHTHWNSFANDIDSIVKENANLIYMTDRVDALRVQIGYASLKEQKDIKSKIEKYKGSMFYEKFVEAFLEVSESDSFWYYMETEPLIEYFDEWIATGKDKEVSFELLKSIALVFANIVDAKSEFTTEHTHGVAALGRYISQLCQLDASSQEKIELAAFFHDLGKLRVSDFILNKAGALNDEEKASMNRHGFDTHMILHKIKGFQEIAKFASMHHETLDGKGYPYHLSADQIPLEVRILTVADIFQALVQNRPYREGMSAGEAYTILNEMVTENKLDADIVKNISTNLDTCYRLALSHS